MSSIRSLCFGQSPSPDSFGQALGRCLAAVVLILANGASASATNLLYVSVLDSTSIVSFNIDGSDGAAIASTKAVFATTTATPYGLTFDHQGNLYAAIAYSNILNKFDATGAFVGTITSPNFSLPNGMAVDAAGNLYVANGAGQTISKFDPAGNYLATIGSSSTLSQPYGLAFDASGYLYASNGKLTTNFISAFDPAGNYSADHSLGGEHLNAPIGMVFDATGNLHVANFDGFNLATFDAAGTFLGAVTGNLSLPYGLTRDAAGNLYAMNVGNGTISKFDPSGAFVTSWLVGGYPIWGTFRVDAVPEIDPASAAGALTLLIGCLGLCERRMRKARS